MAAKRLYGLPLAGGHIHIVFDADIPDRKMLTVCGRIYSFQLLSEMVGLHNDCVCPRCLTSLKRYGRDAGKVK